MNEPIRRSGPLAVLDYGIGGLDFWRTLRQRHPMLSTVYCSDSGYTPYGQLQDKILIQRLEETSQRMVKLGASALVIACNAGSSVLSRSNLSLPTLGIISAGVRLVIASGYRRVAVIGGQRTIESGIYMRALSALGIEVKQEIAQPLSVCIEAGDLSSVELRDHVTRITRPLRDRDAILLACTHYPAIKSLIQQALPGVVLLDPVETLVNQLEESWDINSFCQVGKTQVITTGSPELMRRSASDAFGVELSEIIRWVR